MADEEAAITREHQAFRPEERWQLALELYTTEQVSTGRAAEIAGLGYIMFMEKLSEQRIPLMAAIVTNDAEREREEALLDELLSI